MITNHGEYTFHDFDGTVARFRAGYYESIDDDDIVTVSVPEIERASAALRLAEVTVPSKGESMGVPGSV